MNRMIYKSKNYLNNEYEEHTTGFLETVRWKATSWCGGPNKPGVYIVSNGKGKVEYMQCTGDHGAKQLFDNIMEGYYEDVSFSNNQPLTEKDLLSLYTQCNVWYTTCAHCDYGEYSGRDDLTIIVDDDVPKYFMEPELTGPIDSEMDSCEKTYVDVHGDILKKEEGT